MREKVMINGKEVALKAVALEMDLEEKKRIGTKKPNGNLGNISQAIKKVKQKK